MTVNYFRQAKYNCFCAFCKTPRRVTRQRHIGFVNVVASALVAGLMMEAFFGKFDPRAVVFFAFNLAIAEMFVQFRWRFSLACKVCGFDPVVYSRDPSKAAENVQMKLKERSRDPAKILARPLNLPVIPASRADEVRKVEAAKKNPGKLLSKSI